MLDLFRRRGERPDPRRAVGPCRFVPLIGEGASSAAAQQLIGFGSGLSTTASSSPGRSRSAGRGRRRRGVDEVVAALADEGVGAEVAEQAVGAVVADQGVGAVGALEALVVADATWSGVAAAGGPPLPPRVTSTAVVERP